jgi:hypothetical protein
VRIDVAHVEGWPGKVVQYTSELAGPDAVS